MSVDSHAGTEWMFRGGSLTWGDMPRIVGILNATPDSFSDGGCFIDASAAVDHVRQLVADGADVIDIGGESTRPGSTAVTADEQIRRVLPVIKQIRAEGMPVPISIDTRIAAVASAALRAGANIVNDVSALRDDPLMAEVCRSAGAGLILMHMRGTPANMQQAPAFDDAPAQVTAELLAFAGEAQSQGIGRERIVIDPGIGFGKTTAHNLQLLAGLSDLCLHGYPVMVGASRKRFLGELTGQPNPSQRDTASAVVSAWCASAGVRLVRVHNVSATLQSLQTWHALESTYSSRNANRFLKCR